MEREAGVEESTTSSRQDVKLPKQRWIRPLVKGVVLRYSLAIYAKTITENFPRSES